MIEHSPWIGAEYEHIGVQGERIAIVGYSHWLSKGDEDTADGTITCIRNVMSGDVRISFFTQIRNYFRYDDHAAFWPRVVFFNYLPCCIGGSEERFNHGSPEQLRDAHSRFLSIIKADRPHKVLIFTSRHWAFPFNHREKMNGFSKFLWGTYEIGDESVAAFFLRHPQGASAERMRRAVEYALQAPAGAL